jgi:EmrB/QacA subfamily drug resistance transporter
MPDRQDPVHQKVILAVIAFAVFMATLDTSIVNISLPTIAAWFHADMSSVSWVVMAYLLVISGLMLACGRLGDMAGFRKVFIGGFVIFTAGSLLCGLAASIGLLVAFRVVQGIGAAAIEAIAPAMIAVCLPADKRGWALGIMMTVVSVAIAAGPVLGGVITEYLGWHWVFFVNVPVGVLAIVLAARYLPKDSPSQVSGGFDTTGAVLILIALSTLLFPVTQGLYLGWTSPVVIGSFVLSLIFLSIFIFHERQCKSPLIDLRLFAVPNYLWGNIAGMLVLVAFAGSEFLLPFYFEQVHGISTEMVGILLAVPAVALMLAGPVAGRLSDHYGCRGLMMGAALLCAATLFLFAGFDATTGFPLIIAALALEGIGVGLFMPPDMSLILGSGNREAEGVASGVMMTLRNMGAMLGIAILGTIAMYGAPGAMAGMGGQAADPAALVPGFHAAFLAGMIICILVVVVSGFVRENRTGADAQRPRPE